jgi:hypothetical protein
MSAFFPAATTKRLPPKDSKALSEMEGGAPSPPVFDFVAGTRMKKKSRFTVDQARRKVHRVHYQRVVVNINQTKKLQLRIDT